MMNTFFVIYCYKFLFCNKNENINYLQPTKNLTKMSTITQSSDKPTIYSVSICIEDEKNRLDYELQRGDPITLSVTTDFKKAKDIIEREVKTHMKDEFKAFYLFINEQVDGEEFDIDIANSCYNVH